MVPINKGKGEIYQCKNFRGICILSIPGKVFGSVVIERTQYATICRMGEAQSVLKKTKWWVVQVFAAKQVM